MCEREREYVCVCECVCVREGVFVLARELCVKSEWHYVNVCNVRESV